MINWRAFLFALSIYFVVPGHASTLNISHSPLFLTQAVAPLTLLVMGRDHKLFYEAYNNFSDLNGDGALDIRFDPNITYFGYFDSTLCYGYASSKFSVSAVASETLYTCASDWSGNFLNYITTSRIDALRKVLYGGYRSTDSTSVTVLERSYIPQDAHSWGMEYASIAVDGYNIADYTPYNAPSAGNYVLFANVTLLSDASQLPRLRVANNIPYRIWEWVSIERPVSGDKVLHGGSGTNISGSTTDYIVRVKVCDPAIELDANCQLYPNGQYKPTGILQTYGENDAMFFGLITGSYNKNLEGGVLRKNIGSIIDEINLTTGQFTAVNGVINSINSLSFTHFGGNYTHDCSNNGSSWITTRPINNGECRMWGNPIAEMMYEGLRYFAGKAIASSAYATSGSTDASLNLPTPAWTNPYASPTPWCAKPNMLVISDINPSFDSNSIPGSYFNSYSGDLAGFNASNEATTIWNNDFGSTSTYFVGQSGANYDGSPTAKTVTNLSTIRGLSPEEPTKEGSYYSASAAYFGRVNDISSADNDQNVFTYIVALTSPLPEIKINVNGDIVTLVPFAKSVGGCLGVNGTQGLFQPTNTIVDFYVETITATSGTFRVNFEDVEQGADHDMDAIVKYSYVVNADNTITITLTSTYAAGCIQQHIGYVISGTTADGSYLEVRDLDTSAGADFDYFMDTPDIAGVELPLVASRTFTPSGAPSSAFLKGPLWYAAKWGGFNDLNENDLPDQTNEFDTDLNNDPDNYFLVTNALDLGAKIAAAFNKILERSGSFSSAALSSGFLTTDTKIYQAIFTTGSWKGQLLSFDIDVATGVIKTDGSGPKGSSWDAGVILSGLNWNTGREIITYKPSTALGIAFRWPTDANNPTASELDKSQGDDIRTNPQTGAKQGKNKGKKRLKYLRGWTKKEVKNGGSFRDRASILGDIIQSNPLLIGPPNYQYPDTFSGGLETSYNAFKLANINRSDMIYVGANDGMLHVFDATTGIELLAYVPSKVYPNLSQLTNPTYTHRYYVSGGPNAVDVFYSGAWHTVLAGGLGAGGQGIYALDITDPSTFSESNASSIVLWEFTDVDDSDMGLSFSRPSIVRLANGEWAAVFGNGYNNTLSDGNVSTTGNAVLYIVNIQTGALIKKFDTEFGMAEDPLSLARPNGLSTPTVIDVNGDSIADYIYAGDLFGNMWKIDVTGSNSAQWDFSFKQGSTPEPLFVAEDASLNRQAITGAISVSRVPTSYNTYQVFFGTGKYFEVGNNTDVSMQTFYGIRDNNADQVTRGDLLEQTILEEVDGYRVLSQNILDSSVHRGWYLDLTVNGVQLGERVISEPIHRHNKIIFTSIIPNSDPCEFGGTAWLMEMYAFDGSRLPYTVFDTNDDGSFNSSDQIIHTDGGGNTSNVNASGKQSTVGLVSTPVILNAGDKEYKYLPGSSGNVQTVTENPGVNVTGRQSWRQIK